MLVASCVVAAFHLYSASVSLATPIRVYYCFLLYIVLLVYKEPLYFILMVLYTDPKCFY